MPAPPELRRGTGEVWVAEVARQLYAKEACGADGNVGVSGEVAVDLHGEQQCAAEKRRPVHRGEVAPYRVHDHCARVRHHNLLEEPPKHQAAARDCARVAERPPPPQLREQRAGPLYWARHELREEADVQCEVHRAEARSEPPLVHIDAVAQRLKCVETDADGQGQAQRGSVGMHAETRHEPRGVEGEEAVVLEQAQRAKAHGRTRGADQTAQATSRPGPAHQHARKEADRRNGRYQREEPCVPPGVEHVARRHEEQVLRPQRAEHAPVKREYDGEEEQERMRVERHTGKSIRAVVCPGSNIRA